ncbi:AAA domain-containing protein [Chytriomyces sp. MP71]|nr:AAA domain-containing protein [Chytriomyces sp. MP71]
MAERIKQLQKHVAASSDDEGSDGITSRKLASSSQRELTIGGVTVRIDEPRNVELVPVFNDAFFTEAQEILRHFRWMMQKDALGQDIFLIGSSLKLLPYRPPGPYKRHLVQKYAQLAHREVEFVSLSKDMTDGDLKQRREIRGGTAFYTDQACVRAAIHGRILVLDGIEKAERNVLPIINNLLENREMALEDGRFLVHPKRFDSLVESQSEGELAKWKAHFNSLIRGRAQLVRTSERFIVIGLGLPVPKYEGHPLDPPLRSRFQARNINVPTFLTQISHLIKIAPNVPQKTLERLISVGLVLRAEATTSQTGNSASVAIPEFPTSLEPVARMLSTAASVNIRSLLDSVYPYALMGVLEHEQVSMIEAAYQRFDFTAGGVAKTGTWSYDTNYRICSISLKSGAKGVAVVELAGIPPSTKVSIPSPPISLSVKCGTKKFTAPLFFVQTDYHASLTASLVLAHGTSDICLIGPKGVGKSAILRAMITSLGYTTEYIPVYKDMSARDLLQRRTTNLRGDTIWEDSALIKAAIDGSCAVLDGIEVLAEGVLSSISGLIGEREVMLPDGRLLVGRDRWTALTTKLSAEELAKRGVIRVHDSFRIVALARPTLQAGGVRGNWLSPEIMNMFVFVPMRTLSYEEEKEVIQSISPGVDELVLNELLAFANKLRGQQDDTLKSLAGALSTRQLIRCVRRLTLFPEDSLYEVILKAQLWQFLPSMTREALERLLKESKISKKVESEEVANSLTYSVLVENGAEVLRIGNVSHPVSTDSNKLLIPDIVFYDNPKQTAVLREMLKDYVLGEHLLLIGNQGVGKNKLVDKLLQLLQLPREYIQLHRDSTIHSLTSTPSIVNGVIVYEDSPLVRAAREGFILVVDEADKAPTHVTSVLKSLVEDGEMVLSDGRRLAYLNTDSCDNVIPVHKNFRMFVLANRPGFPFLGNDFYGEIGDVFAAHCVGNPDKFSELNMLKKYAPSVDEDILIKLIDSFNDLRHLVDEGLINYPYSTRELVSVVKHLERFPREGPSRALQNVFDFDSYDTDVKELIITTLSKNGVHIGMQSDFKVELGMERLLPELELLENWNRITTKDGPQTWNGTAEILRFQLLGGWRLNFSNPNDSDSEKRNAGLQRIDARSTVFTEQVYAFKIPCHGEVLDACKAANGGDGNPFFVLATNPIALYCIDGSHRKMETVDLYEFFPLQKNIPSLKMVEILPGTLVLHNADEQVLLVLNMDDKKASSMNLEFHDRKIPSSMAPLGEKSGMMIFSQLGGKQIICVDMVKTSKRSIILPYPANSSITVIGVFDGRAIIPDCLVVQAMLPDNVVQNFILTLTEESWTLERLHVKTTKSYPTYEIERLGSTRFDHFDYPSASFPISLKTPVFSHGSVMKTRPSSFDSTVLANAEAGVSLHHWPRQLQKSDEIIGNRYVNLKNAYLYLEQSKQIVTVIPKDDGKQEGVMEIVNPRFNSVRSIKVPVSIPASATTDKKLAASGPSGNTLLYLLELKDGNLLSVDLTGMARIWQTQAQSILTEMNDWKRLVGTLEVSTLKVLYSDGDEVAEVGQNTREESAGGEGSGAGNGEGSGSGNGNGSGQGDGQGEGTGGSGGASGSGGEGGAGGAGGEPSASGREDGSVDLSSFSLRTANDVPKEVTEAQKAMHEMAMRKRLEQLKMTEKDMQSFSHYRQNIVREIRELRAIIEATEAKNKERVWLRNQSTGDVDDTKLVEGVTGERAIYKRRGEDESTFQHKPKKMFVTFDLSASMTRFNGLDSRLERSLECALLIMEAFKGFEHKFQYKISGHSGDSANVEFVKERKYPKDEKDMFGVLGKMNGHARFCLSGDNTVAAVEHVVQDIVKEEADDYFALILSDANVTQYNIQPDVIAKALKKNEKVNAYIIFIGSIKDQAESLAKAMPGNAFICLNTKDLPKILKTIFVNSMLK